MDCSRDEKSFENSSPAKILRAGQKKQTPWRTQRDGNVQLFRDKLTHFCMHAVAASECAPSLLVGEQNTRRCLTRSGFALASDVRE